MEEENTSTEQETNPEALKHYLESSCYSNPGLYEEYFKSELPDEIKEIGSLVRQQLIHRSSLANGNTGTNADLKYGDMTNVPWFRQPEDDIFVTVPAMMAELFRRDPNGFDLNRKPEDKLILTCRHLALLVASILKTKGIPTRVRSGFASYFVVDGLPADKSDDHWINQYWSKEENRWINIDVDGMDHDYTKLNFFDLPSNKFDFAADAWLKVREGKVDEDYFYNGCGMSGLIVVAWELFYDFHCLMNDEVIYLHTPEMVHIGQFEKLSEEQLQEIDELARSMQDPDKNFQQLKHIWETKKEFRLIKGGVV